MPVRHILVVDDSKSARLMLRKMLQSFGMTVDTAESAEEALNYLRGQQPDAIFMDHTMPGMDGLMALRQIKSDPTTAAIPVAMYTSKDEPAYQEQARAAGAVGVLIKPAVPETLNAILEQMHAAAEAARIPAAAPAPTDQLLNAEWVEKLALEKAELVFYDAIESQVLPLINDVVAKLRRELEANQEAVYGRITTLIETRLAESPPPGTPDAQPMEEAVWTEIAPRLEKRLEAFQREERPAFEDLARDVAGQVCQNQLHELSGQLVRHLSTRFAEAVQKAGLSARQAAVDAAREVALQAVGETTVAGPGEKSIDAAVEQTVRQLWADAQRDLKRRIYLAAGGAAIAGIGAAVLVYGLR